MPSRFLSKIAMLLICCAFFGGAYAASPKLIAELEALPEVVIVNQFYECSLRVTDANGVGMPELRLRVRGRMPEHTHGLPTVPQIIEEGQGLYRIKGLSFSMPGRWIIEVLHDDEPVFRQALTVRF